MCAPDTTRPVPRGQNGNRIFRKLGDKRDEEEDGKKKSPQIEKTQMTNLRALFYFCAQ
jgi:hypothetical protein